MNDEEFWRLISLLDWDKTGDDEAVVEPVVDALSNMPEEEIYAFEDTLAEKLYQLDCRQFAEKKRFFLFKKKNEYLSPDDSLYTRCVVVANGSDFYEQVIQNPKKFPHDLEFEMLLGISLLAYIRKTGKEWDYVPKISYETYSNADGWK